MEAMSKTNPVPIEDVFTRCYQHATGVTVGRPRVVQHLSRDYSEIFVLEFEVGDESRQIVGKRLIPHPSNEIYQNRPDPIRHEFETLEALSDKSLAISTSEFRVPTPRLVDSNEQCYFMDFVQGEELDSMMRRLRFFSPRASLLQLSHTFFQAGRWLKEFQLLTGIEYSDASALESIVEHCEFRLRLIREHRDPRLPTDLSSIVLHRIESLMQQISAPIPIAGCHGDFGPWNMIANGNELTVLDFFAFRREFIALDASNILVTLENKLAAPSFSSWRVEKLVEKFVEGFSPEPILDARALQVAETLYRVCSIQGCLASPGDIFRERLRTHRIVRRNLNWLLSENPQSVWDQRIRTTQILK